MKLKSFFTLKHILLILAVLILLLCLVSVGVLLIKHQHKLTRFNDAMTAYNNGDYESAKSKFEKCLWDQYNNEVVNEKLALISEHENDWGKAIYYWERAMSLNPFKKEYTDAYFKALRMTRNFFAICRHLENKQGKNPLSEDESFMLAYSYLQLGNLDKAKEIVAAIEKPATGNPLAEILEFLLAIDRNTTVAQGLEFMKKYHDNEDPFVALEALYESANYHARANDLENGRKCMERAIEINPFAGKPLMADYLYTLGRISEAEPILEECMETSPTNFLASLLGECYAITNKPDKLKELMERFKTGNQERVITGYYLEALHSFITQNDQRLIECIEKCDEVFMSPYAMLIKLYAATRANDTKRAVTLLRQILGSYRYRSHHKGAVNIGMDYIRSLVTAKKQVEAVEIAEILYNRNQPDLVLTRLIIGSKVANNTLIQSELDFAQKTFPNDPFILSYAAQYYMRKGNFQAALQASQANINANKEAQIDVTPVRNQQVHSLEALGKLDDAKKAAMDMLANDKENVGANILYLDFCARHQLADELKAYASNLGTPASDDFKALQCIALATADMIAGKAQEAPAQLDKITNAIPALLFQAARLYELTQKFDKANETYQKILDKGNGTVLVYAFMSDNFARLQQNDKSMEFAKKACELYPDNVLAQETYAARLAETEQPEQKEEAFRILDGLILDKKSMTRRGLIVWRILIGERTNKILNEEKWDEGLAELKRMQLIFPQDEKVKKAIEQVEQNIKEEREALEKEEREKEEKEKEQEKDKE